MAFQPDDSPRQLGDYLLLECLHRDGEHSHWLAEQPAVNRRVAIDLLENAEPARAAAFMADVRAKAAVDHPLIGSVYEAVSTTELSYFAHEILPGASLAELLAAGEGFLPVRLAHILRRIAEANRVFEENRQSTAPLELEDLFIDTHGVLRLSNLAVAGPREAGESARDIVALGKALPALIGTSHPGASRIATVLAWMRGEGIEQALRWEDIHNYCEQIEQQLAAPLVEPQLPPTKVAMPGSNGRRISWIAATTGIALVVIFLIALKIRPSEPPPPPPDPLADPVTIAAGTFRALDGTEAELAGFLMSAHEVTIGEYDDFLATLRILKSKGRGEIYRNPSQPEEKTSNVPSDWDALRSAAIANGTWQGRKVTTNSPVVGVDWWDADSYATWKKGRLPTQDEWAFALAAEGQNPLAVKPGPWQPANLKTPDTTINGLIGMAGSVSEWMREPAASPANPLGEKLWVIAGGSYLRPNTNALTREYTADRLQRRPDLGFRVVFPLPEAPPPDPATPAPDSD